MDLLKLLSKAPVAYLRVNAHDLIEVANAAAENLGFSAGEVLGQYFEDSQEAFVDRMRFESEAHIYHLKSETRDKRLRIAFEQDGSKWHIWFSDQTSHLALAEKLRQSSDPGARQLKKIHHQVATAMGYAELLDVILSDEGAITPDKLNVVRNYQREVRNSLQEIQSLANQDNTKETLGVNSIMVVEGNTAILELVVELLKLEGYKAVGFSEAAAALEYIAVNEHRIAKAIVDDQLMFDNNAVLVDHLRNQFPKIKTISLTSGKTDLTSDSIQKPLDYELLIRAVQD